MNFNSLEFLVFLPTVLVLHWLMPHRFRWALLLAASWLFYFRWNAFAGLLLVGVTLLSWLCGRGISHAKSSNARCVLQLLALVVCLGCLILFKYAVFFASLAGVTLAWRIILPVGISFYIFQSLSYVIDVYRGRAAEPHFGYYTLFVAFFPPIGSGPH